MKAVDVPLLLTLLLVVGTWGYEPRKVGHDYWKRRAEIFDTENERRMGGDLKLESEQERLANQTLMNAKLKDL